MFRCSGTSNSIRVRRPQECAAVRAMCHRAWGRAQSDMRSGVTSADAAYASRYCSRCSREVKKPLPAAAKSGSLFLSVAKRMPEEEVRQ